VKQYEARQKCRAFNPGEGEMTDNPIDRSKIDLLVAALGSAKIALLNRHNNDEAIREALMVSAETDIDAALAALAED
jgi:hypothetical protein